MQIPRPTESGPLGMGPPGDWEVHQTAEHCILTYHKVPALSFRKNLVQLPTLQMRLSEALSLGNRARTQTQTSWS